MTRTDLDNFLDQNPHIEWKIGEDHVLFRNTQLAWYKNDESRATKVTFKKLDEEDFTPKDLRREINRGLEVDGITRITGYMTKVSSWNPGKLGELTDRRKFDNVT